MRGAVRSKVESSPAPLLDLAPVQMTKPVPGVLNIPGIRLPHVIGDQKGRSREAQIGKHGIGVLSQGSVAVVERQQKSTWCVVRENSANVSAFHPSRAKAVICRAKTERPTRVTPSSSGPPMRW